MFCPNCATKQIDGAHFCRSCGANISLVPQALTGQLQTASPPNDDYFVRRRRRGRAVDNAVRSLTMGVAFAVMAVMTSRFAPGSGRWWFWLLVPALLFFSRGFAALVRCNFGKNEPKTSNQPMVNAVRTPDLPAANTNELMTPVPSVTEGTTRHLGVEAQTQPIEFSNTNKRF